MGGRSAYADCRCPSPNLAGSCLISKVYHVDPLTCRECGGRLQIVAYINDHFTIKKILDHLGLSPPEIERPPRDIRYVPAHAAGPDGLDDPVVTERAADHVYGASHSRA